MLLKIDSKYLYSFPPNVIFIFGSTKLKLTSINIPIYYNKLFIVNTPPKLTVYYYTLWFDEPLLLNYINLSKYFYMSFMLKPFLNNPKLIDIVWSSINSYFYVNVFDNDYADIEGDIICYMLKGKL